MVSTGPLLEQDAAADPVAQFETWFAAAAESDMVQPNAMVLATASERARPGARTVLLKHYDFEAL